MVKEDNYTDSQEAMRDVGTNPRATLCGNKKKAGSFVPGSDGQTFKINMELMDLSIEG